MLENEPAPQAAQLASVARVAAVKPRPRPHFVTVQGRHAVSAFVLLLNVLPSVQGWQVPSECAVAGTR